MIEEEPLSAVVSRVISIVDEGQLNAILEQEESGTLIVVDCFASWCAPCRRMSPIFDALSLEFQETPVIFIKIDMENIAPSFRTKLGVWALPTFLFYRHGQKVGSIMGANPRLLRHGIEHDGQVSVCNSLCNIQ